MKIETDERGNIILKEVYNSIVLQSRTGDRIYICMRDSGFEAVYRDRRVDFKDGIIKSTGA